MTSRTKKSSSKSAKNNKVSSKKRARLMRVKDLALVYFTKGIPGVAALPPDAYSAMTCRKALALLREQGHNVCALENYFNSAKGIKTATTRGISGPQAGEVREYKVQQPKPESRFLIHIPVDIFNVYKGDSVFVHFDNDRIIVSPSSFPHLPSS